jgi:hypothetical protein
MKSSATFPCKEILSWYYDAGIEPSESVKDYIRSQNGGQPLWRPGRAFEPGNDESEVYDGEVAPF